MSSEKRALLFSLVHGLTDLLTAQFKEVDAKLTDVVEANCKHEETIALLKSFPVCESQAPTQKRKTSDPLHKTLGTL